MWEYLKATGVLDKGEDAIRAAKKEWRKIYDTRYKAERRRHVSQHVVSLLPDERRLLAAGAARHGLGVAAFLKKSAIAYATQTYLVHDPATVRKIESLLVRCLSALERINMDAGKGGWLSRKGSANDAKEAVEALRADIYRELRKPDLLVAAILANPDRWDEIKRLIHDS